MAVKRIGFLDNFTGAGGTAAPRRPMPRAWGPGATGWQQRQGFAAPARPTVNTGFAAFPGKAADNAAGGAAAAAPRPPAAPAAPQAGGGRPTLEDPAITSDPLLLKVKKLAQGQRDDASTTALARKKQLAIETGDSGLAREFGLDDTVAQLAAQNPLSQLAVVRDQGRLSERGFNEDANKANLFFSGYRGEQLGELAKALLTAEAQTQSRAREGFGGIESELLGAFGGADRLEMDAETAAYERALDAGAGSGLVDVGLLGVDTGAGGGPTGQQRPGDDAVLSELLAPYFGTGRGNLGGTLAPIGRRKPDPLEEQLMRYGY